MAVISLCENNGDKENVSISPSAHPAISYSPAPFNKKRKLTMPLEDITNLLYPERVPSLQESALVFNTSSLCLRVSLDYQVKNRSKRVCTSTLRNAIIVARPVKPITLSRRALEAQFRTEKMNQTYHELPDRVAPGGPDGHHHLGRF
ncbi:hypothetical protein DH2020_017516 [Rehmannia glutinosa]|uniref:Uncharacterized protein n=1 Tax=Rehmannia glutinosa TaxID=99300 RepID=A0ABR0WRQ9_REHGL